MELFLLSWSRDKTNKLFRSIPVVICTQYKFKLNLYKWGKLYRKHRKRHVCLYRKVCNRGGRGGPTPRGPLPVLLGTDVPLRFSKHTPPFIYSIFLKTIPIHIYFRWKSWPNHIRVFHNSVINVINAGDKLTPIDIMTGKIIYQLMKIAPHWYIWLVKKVPHSSGKSVYTKI
jgi:hypothetical protein